MTFLAIFFACTCSLVVGFVAGVWDRHAAQEDWEQWEAQVTSKPFDYDQEG